MMRPPDPPLALLAVLLAAPLWSSEARVAPVTVLLDFEQSPSETSLAAMRDEAQRLLAKSGVRIDVGIRGQVPPSAEFENLLLFHMKGRCAMDPYPVLFDERGPLAMTYTSDGVVLPFGEIRCDRVKRSLKRTLTGDDYKRGDLVLGRALGRVLAHEMYHMLAGVRSHTAAGVTRHGLTSEDLRGPEMSFDAKALREVRSGAMH